MGTAASGLYEKIFLQSYEKLTKKSLETNDIVFRDMCEWYPGNLRRDRNWLLENRIKTEQRTYNFSVHFHL